jgi:hypothetical protein
MSTLFISWSALKTHEECKQRGKLVRSGHRAPLRDQRIFFAGTTVDRVVRDWLLEDPWNNPGRMPEMVDAIMDRELEAIQKAGGVMRWASKEDRDNTIRDCIEAVTRLEPVLNERVLPFEFQVDYRFRCGVNMPHPTKGKELVILNGAMDIIVHEEIGGETFWDIWDVKMTKDNNYWRKTAGQLTFYDVSRGLHLPGISRHSGLLQPMCDEQVKPYPVTDELRSQMKSRIANMARDVFAENFALAETRGPCNFCDVKHACTRFQAVNSDGKRRISLV